MAVYNCRAIKTIENKANGSVERVALETIILLYKNNDKIPFAKSPR